MLWFLMAGGRCHFGLLFAGSRLRLLHFDISLWCLRQLAGHCCWRWQRVDWGCILIAENSNSFGNHACHFLLHLYLRFVLQLATHLDQLCSWAKDDTVALETISCPLVWSPASALSNSGPPTRYQPEIGCSFWVNIDTSPPSSTLWMGQCLAALHTTRCPKTKHPQRILGTYYCRTSLERDMQESHTTLESIHSKWQADSPQSRRFSLLLHRRAEYYPAWCLDARQIDSGSEPRLVLSSWRCTWSRLPSDARSSWQGGRDLLHRHTPWPSWCASYSQIPHTAGWCWNAWSSWEYKLLGTPSSVSICPSVGKVQSFWSPRTSRSTCAPPSTLVQMHHSQSSWRICRNPGMLVETCGICAYTVCCTLLSCLFLSLFPHSVADADFLSGVPASCGSTLIDYLLLSWRNALASAAVEQRLTNELAAGSSWRMPSGLRRLWPHGWCSCCHRLRRCLVLLLAAAASSCPSSVLHGCLLFFALRQRRAHSQIAMSSMSRCCFAYSVQLALAVASAADDTFIDSAALRTSCPGRRRPALPALMRSFPLMLDVELRSSRVHHLAAILHVFRYSRCRRLRLFASWS